MSNEQLLTIISLGGLILTVALAVRILTQSRATRRELQDIRSELREVARERSERRDRDRKRAQELAPGNLPSTDFQRERFRKRPVSAAL